MANKITDSKKIPELTNSGNLAIVPNSPLDTDPMRQLIERWLTSCLADGLAPATITDYRDKVYKFWWWWSDFTHNSTKIGPHPRNVTFEEAESFAAYLRTPTMFRWGVTGHSRQAANAAAPTRTPKTSKSSNYPLKSPPNSKKPPPKPKKWRSPANAKLQRPLLQPLCPALRHAEAKSQKHKINNSFNHFW